MKNLIIYASTHHENTKEIAKVIGQELNAKLIPFQKATEKDVAKADLIGFGSGIYMTKFNKDLLDFLKSLPKMNNKKVFIFSTSGMNINIFFNRGHKSIKKILKNKGFHLVDEFNCLGYDSYGPLKLFGGVNKGRPNQKDKEEAKNFAKKIKKENEQ